MHGLVPWPRSNGLRRDPGCVPSRLCGPGAHVRVPVVLALLLAACTAISSPTTLPEVHEAKVPFDRRCVETCIDTAECYAGCIVDLRTWEEAASASPWCSHPDVSCTDTPGPPVKWIGELDGPIDGPGTWTWNDEAWCAARPGACPRRQ